MKLYYAKPSPFVRKVMVVAHEAGQAGDIEILDRHTQPTATDPDVAAANPLGKIPCLVRDDGPALYDSRVICRYLDSRADAGLYRDGDSSWTAATLEALADGILDAGVLSVYESRVRSEGARSAEWLAAQRGKIARALDALERRWLGHLTGPLDIGQIASGCALGYLDFRREIGGWPDWRDGRPGLTRWGEAFLAREAMAATAPG